MGKTEKKQKNNPDPYEDMIRLEQLDPYEALIKFKNLSQQLKFILFN